MKNPNVYQKKFRFSFIVCILALAGRLFASPLPIFCHGKNLVCIVQEKDFTGMKNRFDGFIQDSLPRLLYGIP